MASILHRLPRTVLEELARALSSGRLVPPYSGLALREWFSGGDQREMSQELERFEKSGMTPVQIGMVVDLLAAERARQEDERIQMVWTGPDQEGPAVRDTGVVARELLSQATRSLLITTFSISRDSKTFEPVSAAMERNKELDVTLVLNIDMSRQSLFGDRAVAAFAKDFWSTKWPWPTRPRVYFDPRGVVEDPMGRALQHAKCIVADQERVFITSSNYTESGQLRNMELGLVVDDSRLAARIDAQFRSLINRSHLVVLT
jgi:phosphatidylserine/phosphatidylglycerophosphate/cardiolipin synthase-like enzyme